LALGGAAGTGAVGDTGAARRASKTQRKRFQEIAFGMEQAAKRAGDLAFMRLDREFNLLLLEAYGNELGAATLGLLGGLSRRFWYAHYQRAADLPRTARLTAVVARAIAGEDERAAAAASDELIEDPRVHTSDYRLTQDEVLAQGSLLPGSREGDGIRRGDPLAIGHVWRLAAVILRPSKLVIRLVTA
jgi:DNA-binding FadR family transcriptional regulator